ncbi:MotA/TolQ/ExbB proton channel family protein [Vibrio sp. Isolate34]|uniref:MotA/TolQ/ExbB proton channel family protein n=1 Tax=Vibrio sp. Isolate34 TaxID=2908540 RepID=UPI001EFE914D|nr:MotA/TolQ/ExbB proton channel family protein [Vibrio sp. Isolate34]MCG9642086.1 MotA/TolQ/ExbB proton channel family protein [Vibrio sp. Isolate34]
MSDFIASMIAAYTAPAISDLFILIIMAVFGLGLFFSYKSAYSGFVASCPNLLTSLGILGTFTGIVVGLMEFDPANIDDSITLLLAGLKTAFLTSLVGMFLSILFKGINGLLTRTDDEVIEDVGPSEIYNVMNAQLESTKLLVSSIQGTEDSSLTSQIKNLRTDINDGNRNVMAQLKQKEVNDEQFANQLWNKMNEFGELLSKSATEQVINALKEVIVEFNDKLTEQFGENFKRLDESVKKLVEWQENYRLQLEDMSTKYQLGVDAISSTEKSVASINERAETIPATMEKLHEVMELGHGQVTELEERMKGFSELKDKAVEAMPEIKQQLDSTMSTIDTSVKAASDHYEKMLKESQGIIDSFSTTATDSVENMRTNIETGVDNLNQRFSEGADNLTANLDSKTVEISTALATASEQFVKTTDDSMTAMRSNLESGAQEISTQLTQSAHDIGGKLVEASSDIQEQVGTATGGLSNVTSHLTDTTEQIRQHLEDSITELNGQLRVLVADIKEDSRETGKVLKEANQELLSSTRDIQSETTAAFTKLQDRLETTLEDVFQVQAQAVRRTFDSLEDQITESVGRTGSAVEKQVEVLDLQMQQEINRTMSEMGEALATVTQQFTRDYRQLVHEMSNVVNTKMAS